MVRPPRRGRYGGHRWVDHYVPARRRQDTRAEHPWGRPGQPVPLDMVDDRRVISRRGSWSVLPRTRADTDTVSDLLVVLWLPTSSLTG